MTHRDFTLAAILALALAGGAVDTGAETARPPTEKRGFNGESAFQVSGLDNVNLFNGSLVVSLPLGSYSVSPDLSYGLSLVYSSTAGWDPIACPEGTLMPDPDANNTGGFKWTIQLGNLKPATAQEGDAPWVYDRPDGGRRGYYSTLHPGAPSQAGVYYSNDGSYSRLTYTASGGACEGPAGVTAECLTLEISSRVVHEFRKVRTEDEVYRLTRMRDLYGNYVDVTYTDTEWQLTDSLGRTQTLVFGGPAGEYSA
jgi:hypothetical protein